MSIFTDEQYQQRIAETQILHTKAFTLWEATTGDYVIPLDGKKALVKALLLPPKDSSHGPAFLDVRGRRISKNQYNILYLDPKRYYTFSYLKYYSSLPTYWLIIFNDGAGYVEMPNNEVKEIRKVSPNDPTRLYFPTASLTWVSDECFNTYFPVIESN